jgi:rhodanese-related sulfurtransferase
MNGVRRTLTVTAAVLGGGAALAGAWSAVPYSQVAQEIDAGRDHISAVEVAELLMHGSSGIRVFDLRSTAEFQALHIPGAEQATVSDLIKANLPHYAPIVMYSAGGAHAAQAWMLLRFKGYRNVFVLREGVYEWMATVVQPQLAVDATVDERKQFERGKVLSHFFGGSVTVDVPRAEIRKGYWTGSPNDGTTEANTALIDSNVTVRRRGC